MIKGHAKKLCVCVTYDFCHAHGTQLTNTVIENMVYIKHPSLLLSYAWIILLRGKKE